jgi:hypothetical protein
MLTSGKNLGFCILNKAAAPALPTKNQQQTTNNRQPTTDNRQQTTDNRQPTTNIQQPSTRNPQPYHHPSLSFRKMTKSK